MAIILIGLIVAFFIFIYIFIHLPAFGKKPTGERLEKVSASIHFRNGKFQNIHHTPIMAEGGNPLKILREFMQSTNRMPEDTLPSVKTNLHNLKPDADVLVWFGHSSYYLQIDDYKILVDPVLSGHASPVSFITRAFKGADIYNASDIPYIDYLFITHDHWDHLDYRTLLQLKFKIKTIICALGVGEHLEYWGFDKNRIIERDWDEVIRFPGDLTVYTIPARHFSGRGPARNHSQWTSYLLKVRDYKIYIGGDSGYDNHFAEAQKRFGAMDLAILENGQYNHNWRYIHMLPNEVLQAARDLQARRVLPVHSCKFALGIHPWYEPLTKISELNKIENLSLLTPKIGEPVFLKDDSQNFSNWWEGIR